MIPTAWLPPPIRHYGKDGGRPAYATYNDRNAADYFMPTAVDLREQVAIVVSDDAAVNSKWSNSLGEIGIIGAATAAASAVYNATRVGIRNLPIRYEATSGEPGGPSVDPFPAAPLLFRFGCLFIACVGAEPHKTCAGCLKL